MPVLRNSCSTGAVAQDLNKVVVIDILHDTGKGLAHIFVPFLLIFRILSMADAISIVFGGGHHHPQRPIDVVSLTGTLWLVGS